jgi:hypothetical protein
MAKTEIKLNQAGVRKILRSDSVEEDLLARAQRVAAAAEPNAPSNVEIRVDSGKGATRARATVVALGGYKAELEDRFLSSAIDAAR